jgi:hypothetical protein
MHSVVFWIFYTVLVECIIHPSFGVIFTVQKRGGNGWLECSEVKQRLVSDLFFCWKAGLESQRSCASPAFQLKKPTLSSVASPAVAINSFFVSRDGLVPVEWL